MKSLSSGKVKKLFRDSKIMVSIEGDLQIHEVLIAKNVYMKFRVTN